MSIASAAITQTNNEFNAALSKQKGSEMDKESFLLLLVTQFKYQDPLNPMEDQEFIAQMAQFSSLEQLMNLNDSMGTLTDATNNQQMINATSYIGKQVTVSGNTIGKVTDTTNNTMSITEFRYAPADNTAGGTLTVRDSSNNVVYTEQLAAMTTGSTYTFSWDGKTSLGTVAPDGVYTVNIALLNSAGEAVLSDQVVDATVTGVVNNNGTVCLGLDGGQLMELANVRQVSQPKVISTGDSTSTSTTSGTSSGTSENTSNSASDSATSNNSASSGSKDTLTAG